MNISYNKLSKFWYLGRFNNQVGSLLLMLPSFWSISLIGVHLPLSSFLYYFTIFFVCSILMRAAGCVVNDIFDRKIDRLVDRTKNRPVANGNVSIKEALVFLFTLLIIPFFVFLSFNNFAKFTTLACLLLMVIYPLSKRYIKAPQLVLGITFNSGILLADAIINTNISTISILIFLSSIFWTLTYDTVYAYQDYKDDITHGIKSLAVLLGNNNKNFLYLFTLLQAVIFIYGVVLFYEINNLSLMLVMASFSYLFYNLYKVDINDTSTCYLFFKNNATFGCIVLFSLLVNNLV